MEKNRFRKHSSDFRNEDGFGERIVLPIESLRQGKVKSLSHVRLFATPWTVALQVLQDPHAPPSMGFSRQEYWSGLPFPSPEDLPDPGIKLRSPTL